MKMDQPAKRIAIETLRLDARLQARSGLDADTVELYAERMSAGDRFPAIVVYVIDGELHVVDGFHRVESCKRAGFAEIDAVLHEGTFDDAFGYTLHVNSRHGKPRTREDLRATITRALRHPSFVTHSDSWLAKDIGTTDKTVRVVREEMESASEIPNLDKLLGEDGKWYPRKQTEKPFVVADYYTLETWSALSKADRSRVLKAGAGDGDSGFNKQESDNEDSVGNIEWAKWSWNPITGCKHDCPYCYARDIADRFYPQGFAPALHPKRLRSPQNVRVPAAAEQDTSLRNVFTCSMADLFGRWVPREWIEAVLQAVADAPQWNFLFLTKFPKRLSEFDFPGNAWIGTSVDCQARVRNAEAAFAKVKASVKWLSIEPMIEPIEFGNIGVFDWIVIGGASKSTQTPEWRPPRAWVEALECAAFAAGCKVYEKTNLLRRWKHYPGRDDVPPERAPDVFHYLKRTSSTDQQVES